MLDVTKWFYEVHEGQLFLRAMPLVIGVLGLMALAYSAYSRFLAARVAALDDARATPAHTLNDGQNYHPTNRWVLFGHHFAAISGAGPLIGPVLAMQYGYMPGLIWLVAGVCLAGAVQDMLVLAASVRHDGKSLGHIAREQLGPTTSVVVSAAILFVVVIALAGLGMVVVKALGGEEVALETNLKIRLPEGETLPTAQETDKGLVYPMPPRCELQSPRAVKSDRGEGWTRRDESFVVRVPTETPLTVVDRVITLPRGAEQVIPGSSWGTFTIACTIPIALFVGLWMYKVRKGHVVEASVLGGIAVIGATIVGNWIPGSALAPYFTLTREQTILAMVVYGFVASVLPVWLLLCPRDYLSSFLKIGTIFLLVVGVIVANPLMRAAPLEDQFLAGGPTFRGSLFPFVFICIMCGAVSGFHALVSSGTTPKMIDKESDVRPIGYGAMLMESLVGVMALIAAASLHPQLYYDINVPLNAPPAQAEVWQKQINAISERASLPERNDPLHQAGVREPHQLGPEDRKDLARVEEMVGGESLRGRTGGAVTLAVGMSLIFTDALDWTGLRVEAVMKYWYHFAIMFEALFILTTIDTGTRIARLLLQETLGKIWSKFAQVDWAPGAIAATGAVTLGWGLLIQTNSIDTIWPMFGISNQLLAVIALCLVSTWLVNTGKARYLWVTLPPMVWVIATTMTAGVQLIWVRFIPGLSDADGHKRLAAGLNLFFTVFVMGCVLVLLLSAGGRWGAVILRQRGNHRREGFRP